MNTEQTSKNIFMYIDLMLYMLKTTHLEEEGFM